MRTTITIIFMLLLLVACLVACSTARPGHQVPERTVQARLISYEATGFNRFNCRFVTMAKDTMNNVPWYVPGAKKAILSIGAWHTVSIYPGNKVHVIQNK